MAEKVTETDPDREHHDRPSRDNALVDLRALIVLLLSAGAGGLAHHESGWFPGLGVGIAAATALNALLRR
jgi:hypothetical protein